MRAIQHFLPHPRHTEVHRIFVNASPEQAWEAARHFDMADVAWVRMLFEIRTLPDKIVGKQKSHDKMGLGVDEITKKETGFMILQEIPGKEVVVGSVGQFWHLNIPFRKVDPADFRDFNEEGYGKLAWSIAVEPLLNGSTIALELRTTATDDESWKKLNAYYHVIGIGSRLIRSSLMAHLEAVLGKMKFADDDERPLPGDELIPDAKYGITFHRNIEAPAEMVWRYLMQLGCDRAGWYSIDSLDNGGRKSTDHLVEGWEHRSVGDKIPAAPEDEAGFFNVYLLSPEKYFVIGGETVRLNEPFKMTWSFILEPIGHDATHLITRARMHSTPPWKEWLMANVAYPPIHALMSRVQLDTIQKLAERDAQAREALEKGSRFWVLGPGHKVSTNLEL